MAPLPLLLLLASLLAVADAAVPAVIVFGDSSVDPGNNNAIPTIAKSNFPPYGRDFAGGVATGRFSNGRLATDFITEELGIKPTVPAYLDTKYGIEDFATGVSFASAATGLDNITADELFVMPIWRQVELFQEFQLKLRQHLGDDKASATLAQALYIISIGTNDFVMNYYASPVRSSRYDVEEYENFLVGITRSFVSSIHRLGARRINLTGLCPMGCMPIVRMTSAGSGCNEGYNAVARSFNGKLQVLVRDLNSELADARLVYVDVFEPFQEAFQQPHKYGFENSAVGCCATGFFGLSYACLRWTPFTCQDATKYIFWDAFHSTEAMNRLVANHVMNTSLKVFT